MDTLLTAWRGEAERESKKCWIKTETKSQVDLGRSRLHGRHHRREGLQLWSVLLQKWKVLFIHETFREFFVADAIAKCLIIEKVDKKIALVKFYGQIKRSGEIWQLWKYSYIKESARKCEEVLLMAMDRLTRLGKFRLS